ncbi:hypothetical protein ABIB62_002062 [Mucilaginibacter sp. UYP25]
MIPYNKDGPAPSLLFKSNIKCKVVLYAYVKTVKLFKNNFVKFQSNQRA